MLRARLAVVLLAVATYSTSAAAVDCSPPSGNSPCLDGNTLWRAPGQSRWLSIAGARSTAPGNYSFEVQAQLLSRPLTLEVPGPTAGPREIRVVESAIDHTWLLAFGLGNGWDLGAVVAVALWQRGSGIEGITAARGAALDSTATRDPRVTVGRSLRLAASLHAKARVDVSLPLGDTDGLASAGAFTLAPALAAEWRLGRVQLGADVGVRLRRAVELGTARFGSAASVAVGASAELVEQRRLWVAVEWLAQPSLVDATSHAGRKLGVDYTLVPSEWLASVGARPAAAEPWFLVVGAGSGLALSAEQRDRLRYDIVAPTTPKLRAIVAVRYAP